MRDTVGTSARFSFLVRRRGGLLVVGFALAGRVRPFCEVGRHVVEMGVVPQTERRRLVGSAL